LKVQWEPKSENEEERSALNDEAAEVENEVTRRKKKGARNSNTTIVEMGSDNNGAERDRYIEFATAGIWDRT
jgi:hypothetical protein